MLDPGWRRLVHSPEEMVALGREMSSYLKDGAVLALQGGLGAGKTHLTKGVVAGLECLSAVTSPTFTLVHEYSGGVLGVYHFDFYRMESEDEVLRIGWDEYLAEPGVIIVEWPDKFPELIPAEAIWLRIDMDGESRLLSRI